MVRPHGIRERGSDKRGISAKPSPDELKDVCAGVMSQHREEYDRALTQYCSPDCMLDNDDIWLNGVPKIRRVLDFTTYICKDSGVVGDPVWDGRARTATYMYYRYLKLGKRIEQTTVLHFEPVRGESATAEGDGSGPREPRLWVTVIGDKHVNMPWTGWPLIGQIHLYFFRPMFSYFLLGLAWMFTRAR